MSDQIVTIDTHTAGMSSVTASFFLPAPRPALIECGPALSIDNVVSGLEGIGVGPSDLAYLLVSHIHLDHAGGAGDIAQAFPSATIVVSEVGAPHLSDPGKLNASSRRVYGAAMDQIYGDCTPIPKERMLAVADGDSIDLGGGRALELLYTPGHAKHHIGMIDSDTGALFSGDSVGMKVPGMHHLHPAAPPPDFDPTQARRTLHRYIEREPTRVYLAHYGPIDPPMESLESAARQLEEWTDVAESAYREHDEIEHLARALEARFGEDVDRTLLDEDQEAARRIQMIGSFKSNAAGFLRYFRQRSEERADA